jgi:tetratricopeptide (TPR) repeat protein
MVIVAYLPVLQAELIWDDGENITTNQTLRSLDGLREMWLVPKSIQQYYPLMYTTYWVEYHLWGLRPFGYHLVNVLLHGANAVLVWRLLARLGVPGAWLAAALFAVHPVEVESVAWVTERKNVMSLAFALLSMLAYFRFDPPEQIPVDTDPPSRSGSWRWYAASLALFALALFSKTMVVTLPAVLLVIYWWKRGRLGWRDAVRMLPFFALAACLGLVTVWMETHHVMAQGDEWTATPIERILLAGRALWFYPRMLVWPYPLVFLYPRWDIDPRAWWQYLFPAAALLLPGALWLARGKIGRGPLAAVLIFAGVLMPALGFFNIYYMRYAQVSDHFQYHASIALIALAAAGGAVLVGGLRADTRGLGRIVAASALVVLAALSFRQTFVYRDQPTLLSDIIEKNPRNWMPYANLAELLDDQGRYEEAAELLTTCIARCDEAGVHGIGLFEIHRKLGFVLMEAGRYGEAEAQFARALEGRPYDCRTLYGQGMALGSVGRWSEAQVRFEKALGVDPNYAEGRYGLALALANDGRADEAQVNFQNAIALNPADPLPHFGLANMLASRGDLRAAVPHYFETVRLNPNNAPALNNLGVILKDLGEPERAIPYLRAALQHNPANEATKEALKQALERSGR